MINELDQRRLDKMKNMYSKKGGTIHKCPECGNDPTHTEEVE
jgi:predicted RNA-binding Zn-ribbon protein involved in translation (DUF1610 family)